jgi:hypothetical protein
VYHLKLEITKKAANTLKGVDAFLLHVYAPSKGTDIEKSVASNKRVSECKASSHEEPLSLRRLQNNRSSKMVSCVVVVGCSRIVVF